MRNFDSIDTVYQAIQGVVPGFDWNLAMSDAGSHRRLAKEMREIHDDMQVDLPPIPYARYHGTVAHRVVEQFYCDHAGVPRGWNVRLCGSGMGAIRTTAQVALGVFPGRLMRGSGSPSIPQIVAGKVLYGLTPEVLGALARNDRRVHMPELVRVDAANTDEVVAAMQDEPAVLFLETVGNGKPMPVADVREIMRRLWQTQGVVIIDNTFLTVSLLNFFYMFMRLAHEFSGPPRFMPVYVESLSKYYRAGENDTDSGGLIVAPQDFIGLCDALMQYGDVMPNSVLRQFPFDLFRAAFMVTQPVSENASAAAAFLRKHHKVRCVWYPDDNAVILCETGGRAGGVLYFELDTDDREESSRLLEPHIPFRASFGHADTTHVPFGKFGASEPGMIRIAVGFREEPHETVAKLEAALGPR